LYVSATDAKQRLAALLEAAEEADHLVSPEDAVRIAIARQVRNTQPKAVRYLPR
jgi:hypothetical protein